MNVVFFDDEDILFTLIKRYFDILKVDKYMCSTSPIEVENYLKTNKVDILFIDYNMPEVQNINNFIENINKNDNLSIVVTSGEDDNYIKDRIKFSYTFLKKPFILDDLKKIIF